MRDNFTDFKDFTSFSFVPTVAINGSGTQASDSAVNTYATLTNSTLTNTNNGTSTAAQKVLFISGKAENITVNGYVRVLVAKTNDIDDNIAYGVAGIYNNAPATVNNISLQGNTTSGKRASLEVAAGGTVNDAHVKQNASLYVLDGGTSNGAIIDGTTANEYVYKRKGSDDKGKPYASRPNSDAVSNTSEIINGGGQFVYNYGVTHSAKVSGSGINSTNTMVGSRQDVYDNGTAYDTEVSGGGGNSSNVWVGSFQWVRDLGVSHGTKVTNGGMQYVSGSGVSHGSSIAGPLSSQQVYGGGVANDTTLSDGAQQTVKTNAVVNNTILNSGSVQIVYDSAIAYNSSADNSAIIAYSGSQLTGHTQLDNGSQMVLSAAASAETVTIHDANSLLRVTYNNSVANPTDYVATIDTLNAANGGIVRFDKDASKTYYQTLEIGTLSGNNVDFQMNTSINDGLGNFITINQASGSHKVTVADSGAEITDPVSKQLNLINDKSSGASFALTSVNGLDINAVDGGTYIYNLYNETNKDGMVGNVWYLKASLDNTTTPSTDAMISIASAGHNIFYGELQALRQRKGDLESLSGEMLNFWTRALGSRTDFDFGLANYRLKQKGIEFGADKAINVASGRVLVGGVFSYTKNDIDHDRGGTSKIDSYSLSIFATYFNDNGFYLDGILKANRYNVDVDTRMTNGGAVNGSYTQNSIGVSLEAGYHYLLANGSFIEPYLIGTYYTAEGKDVTLSNDMYADLGNDNSARLETGVTLGHEFTLQNGAKVKPYLRAAFEYEFVDSNDVIINRLNRFNNDFSGGVGKYGIGINAQVADKITLYGELNYRRGNGVETPIMGDIGLRVKF